MTTFIEPVRRHLERVIQVAAETCDDMWPSAIDTRTGQRMGGDHVPKRVYRLIGAPGGSTLYWDQPLIVAARQLSGMTGDRQYAVAVDRYVDAFLARCVGENGMFRWGNHEFYDLEEKRLVPFHKGYHELRPITPEWAIFWEHDAEATARYIRTMGVRHLYDPRTGAFNRHDDGKKSHAFIEAGGILCESLAWLYQQTGESEWLDTARRIAQYSYDHRDRVTGLVPNEPDKGRWDSQVCTSEIGLWAQCLLRGEIYSGGQGDFADMAGAAVRAYLEWAFDDRSGQYFGQVNIHDGQAVVPDQPGYWPRQYANPWNTDQWPTHDYPVALADACLTLFVDTQDHVYREGVERIAAIVVQGRPAENGTWAYAEHYGQAIQLLVRAGRELGNEPFLADASSLANEATVRLIENGMFQGYPASHVYESVDGVGYLLQALLELERITKGPA